MLWKNHDITSMIVLASNCLKSADLKYIFNHICKEPRDSLLIDTIRTAISIPASTSLLVLNCTYSGNVTINFDQSISNYCQSGISVFFTGTSPSSWILNNTNGNILFMMHQESNVHTRIHIQWFTMLVSI